MAVKVVVVGGGPGGFAAALRAAQLGADVTLVERDKVGGTCLNWGCIPSKIMKTTAEMSDAFRTAAEFGIQTEGRFRIDMRGLAARKKRVIQTQAKGMLALLSQHNIRWFNGSAFLSGGRLVTISGPDGGITETPWDRLILAPGSSPAPLPALSFDGKQIISSNEALCLQTVPSSMLIVGAGVVGCEFAFIFSSLGTKVVLVEALTRVLPLPSVDEACSKILLREMKKRNIEVLLGHTVETVEKTGERLHISLSQSKFSSCGEKDAVRPVGVETDLALVCIGRRPNPENMGFDQLGVHTDDRGWILADDRMETNISGVYAVGDALGPDRVMLAHVASAEGRIAAENAMGKTRIMRYNVVPAAIFTTPEIACVGMTETQATATGYRVHTADALFRSLGKAHVIGEIAGEAKIVFDADTGRILGVHLVGAHATELVAEAVVAMEKGASIKDLAEAIHPHPTLSEIMGETALKALQDLQHE